MARNNHYFSRVLKCRKLISSLVFFFSLALTLNAFDHCALEHDSPSPEGAETSPFLRPYIRGHEKTSFAKMQKNVVVGGNVPFLQETTATTILRPPRLVLVPSSVPIYQLQTVYRI
jgi:hypothetical protein